MATKLKKHNPFLAFLVYFMSFSVFLVAISWAVVQALYSGIATDYKQSGDYRNYAMGNLLRAGYALASDAAGENMPREKALALLDGQGGNLSYLIYGAGLEKPLSSGTDAATADEFTAEILDGMELSRQHYEPLAIKASDTGYDHLLVIRGNQLYEELNVRTGHVMGQSTVSMSQYSREFGYNLSNNLNALGPDDVVICLAVRAEGAFTNNYGSIYESYYWWYTQMLTLAIELGAALVALLAFLAVRFRKQSLDIARAKLAAFTGWFWVEVKAVALFLAVGCVIAVFESGGYIEDAIAVFCLFWGLWLLWNDLRRNKSAVFRHNILNSVKRVLARFDSKYPFCARMKRRILFLVLAEAGLAFLCLLILVIFQEFGIVLDIFLVGLGLFLLVHYINTYNKDVDAFAAIIDYAAKIRTGTAAEPLRLPPDSAFASVAADLNDIHSGMEHMVSEQVRSEKMKVELITNVSHDLKTPLTSIINYADLLSKENLAPEFANDYVQVLQGKAERLKNLVQDLFEISKANSGAIDLHLEQLNIQSLVEQTVAELDQRTQQAGVETKLQMAGEPLVVRADGKKLHRVLENLLGNALKYSMTGTRVYVTVRRAGEYAQVIFKNVSSYEMTFTADEIVERFQRGDASRTSEGSGLGLAIAKSFLELCGGSLQIELDGDLFKAIVLLPLYVPYERRELHQDDEVPAAPVTSPPPEALRTPASQASVPQTREAPRPQKVKVHPAASLAVQAPASQAVAAPMPQRTETPQADSQQPFFRKAEGGGLVSGPHAETAVSDGQTGVQPVLELADAVPEAASRDDQTVAGSVLELADALSEAAPGDSFREGGQVEGTPEDTAGQKNS